MRPVRLVLGGLIAALLGASPAQAGWHSAFQVTCFHRSAPAVAFYAPDPCPPQPQQVCTTRYQQRCYYQPYTTYKLETYYEPVTTYRTSYYYEPVTTYRQSFYFDPCTCRFQRVCTPVTSYRLRSQCCPVTSYVQRCGYVPVTSYRQCCYWEPQTCCSLVDPCTGQPITSTPTVTESPRPRVSEYQNGVNRSTYPPVSPMIEGSGSSFQPIRPNIPAAIPPAPQPPKPIVPKYDRITLDAPSPSPNALLVGQVVNAERRPAEVAALVFISDSPGVRREVVMPDRDGKFQVNLAAGNWRVYVRDHQGQPVYQQTVEVKTPEVMHLMVLRK